MATKVGSMTLVRTTAALAGAGVRPQADRSMGADEVPSGGGWPWTSQRFDLVGLLFAINLPLAALSFSAFRWYLQRRSAT